MRLIVSALLLALLSIPAFGAPSAPPKKDDDAAAKERQVRELTEQLQALEKKIAALREEAAKGPADEARQRAIAEREQREREMAEQRKRQEQTQKIRATIGEFQAQLAKLFTQSDLSPQQMRERLLALLEEQQQTVRKMGAVEPTKEPARGAGVGAVVSRPPTVSIAKPKADLVQALEAAGQFKTFLALVKQAGLMDTLREAGPCTVFAPTDAALAKAFPQTDRMTQVSKERLVALLQNHIVAKAKMRTHDVGARKTLESLAGRPLIIESVDGKVTVGPATIVVRDIEASNGVIQGIDAVLTGERR
jgi:uncharacterized surface protein with fasciclin (FAS1) repeats